MPASSFSGQKPRLLENNYRRLLAYSRESIALALTRFCVVLYQNKKYDIPVIVWGQETPGNQMDLHNIHNLGYVIHEGLQGRHILFDNKMIRDSFSRDEKGYIFATREDLDAAKAALNVIAGLPSLAEKKEFVSSLPLETRDLLIYFYFQFLDKFLQELRPTIH